MGSHLTLKSIWSVIFLSDAIISYPELSVRWRNVIIPFFNWTISAHSVTCFSFPVSEPSIAYLPHKFLAPNVNSSSYAERTANWCVNISNENQVAKMPVVEVQKVEIISTTPPESFLVASNKSKESLNFNSNAQFLSVNRTEFIKESKILRNISSANTWI